MRPTIAARLNPIHVLNALLSRQIQRLAHDSNSTDIHVVILLIAFLLRTGLLSGSCHSDLTVQQTLSSKTTAVPLAIRSAEPLLIGGSKDAGLCFNAEFSKPRKVREEHARPAIVRIL